MTLLLLATGVKGACPNNPIHHIQTYYDSCSDSDRPVFFYWPLSSGQKDFKVRLDNMEVTAQDPSNSLDSLGQPQKNGEWNGCSDIFTSWTGTPIPPNNQFNARIENNDEQFKFKTKNGYDGTTQVFDFDLYIDDNTDPLSFTIAVLSSADQETLSDYHEGRVKCSLPQELGGSCGTPTLTNKQGWRTADKIWEPENFGNGRMVQNQGNLLLYELDETNYNTTADLAIEDNPCGSHSITLKDTNTDLGPFELLESGFFRLKSGESWPVIVDQAYIEFTFIVVYGWSNTPTTGEQSVTMRFRNVCLGLNTVPYVAPNPINLDRTIGGGMELYYSSFNVFTFPNGCSDFYEQNFVSSDTDLLNTYYRNSDGWHVVPAAFNGAANQITLSVNVLIKLKTDPANNDILDQAQFSVTINYICTDPPDDEELDDEIFDVDDLKDDYFSFWRRINTVSEKNCVVLFSIDSVYEVQASDVKLDPHPFRTILDNRLDGYIRLEATNPEPLVYKIKIAAQYLDSTGSPQFIYYYVKVIGDPCYNLLDDVPRYADPAVRRYRQLQTNGDLNALPDDSPTTIELMNPAVLQYEFGMTYAAVPENLVDVLRECTHTGQVRTPTLDDGLASTTYGIETYVDQTDLSDPTIIFEAHDIQEDTLYPIGQYLFDLTLSYRDRSWVFPYQFTNPDRCAKPFAKIESTCPNTFSYDGIVRYYDDTTATFGHGGTSGCTLTLTPDNCSNVIAGTVTNIGQGTFGHAEGEQFDYASIGRVVVIDELITISHFDFQLTYGTDVTKEFSFNFVFEKCPCNSFEITEDLSHYIVKQTHPNEVETAQILEPSCNDPRTFCRVPPDKWLVTFQDGNQDPLDTEYFSYGADLYAPTTLTLKQTPESATNTTGTVTVKFTYERGGAFNPDLDLDGTFDVEHWRQPRCYDYAFETADNPELVDFDYDVGNTVTIDFIAPKCQQPNPADNTLILETEWDYTITESSGSLTLPEGVSIDSSNNQITFARNTEMVADTTWNFVLEASGRIDSTKKAHASFKVDAKCRCLVFTIDLQPESSTQIYSKTPQALKIADPVCALAASCGRPDSWIFNLADGSTGDPYPQDDIKFSSNVDITIDQIAQPLTKETKFTVKVEAVTTSTYIKNDKTADGELIIFKEFDATLQWCECDFYEIPEIDDVTSTFGQVGEQMFQIPYPECIDTHALNTENCAINGNWTFSGHLKSGEDLPTLITVSGRDVVVFALPTSDKLYEPITFDIKIHSVAQYQSKFLKVLEADQDFTLTFNPCYCKDYKIGPIENFNHTYATESIIIPFEEPVCSLDLPICIWVTEWNFKATQVDDKPLPSGISFDAQKLEFKIDQTKRNPKIQVFDIKLEATTEESVIADLVIAEFQVTLDPGEDDNAFVNEDALQALEGEGILITVEPSLSSPFQMTFDEKFNQKFTFAILPKENVLTIEAKSNEFPYIKTSLSEQTLDVSIDGADALKFLKAEVKKTASFDIKVNNKTFTFTIKMSPAFAGIDIVEVNKKSKAAAKIYGVPTEQDEDSGRKREITASLTKIEKNGAVSISYEPPIALIPDTWKQTFVEEERLKLSLEERKEREEDALYLMHVVFLKNSEEDEQKYFISNLTEWTPAGVTIQLNFSDPLLVSQGMFKDQIKVKLHKNYFLNPKPDEWVDRRQLEIYKEEAEYITFTQDMPLLVASQEAFEKLDGQAKGAQNVIQGQFFASFVLQIFMSGALSMLWNIFNTLQIILALNLLMISFPANVELMQEQFTDMVNMELLPENFVYDTVLQPTFNLETSESKELRAELEKAEREANGEEVKSQGILDTFSGKSTLSKIFDLLLAFILLFTVILIVLCCKFAIVPRCPSCFQKIMKKIERKLFWNSVLRACLETYLGTCIFVFVSMSQLDTGNEEGRIEFLSWLGVFAYVVVFPYMTFRILYQNQDNLWTQDIRERYGSLYTSVEIYKGPIAFSFTLYFCLRRLLFAYTIASEQDTIVFQVFILDYLSTMVLAYFITVQPMEDSVNNFIMIFNEWAVLTCIQMMFLFSPYVNDPVVRYDMGHYFLYFVAFNILVNLIILVMIIGKKIYKLLRGLYQKRQLKKAFRTKIKNAMVANQTGQAEGSGAFGGLFFLNSLSNKVKPQDPEESDESSSSSSSGGQSSFSDEEDAPTREQIIQFSDSEFRLEYSSFMLACQHNIGSHSVFTENPYLLDVYLACHKFELQGYRFSERHRTAKQIHKKASDSREFVAPWRPSAVRSSENESALKQSSTTTHMIDTTDGGIRKLEAEDDFVVNIPLRRKEDINATAERTLLISDDEDDYENQNSPAQKVQDNVAIHDLTVHEIEEQVNDIMLSPSRKNRHYHNMVNEEDDLPEEDQVDEPIQIVTEKGRRKNRLYQHLMDNAGIQSNAKPAAPLAHSKSKHNRTVTFGSTDVFTDSILGKDIVPKQGDQNTGQPSDDQNMLTTIKRDQEAHQRHKTRFMRNMLEFNADEDEPKANETTNQDEGIPDLELVELELQRMEERNQALNVGGAQRKRRNRHFDNVMAEVEEDNTFSNEDYVQN